MCTMVRQSDMVYQDLIYIQLLGTYLRLKGRCTISHKPLALKPVGKTTQYETTSCGTVTTIISAPPHPRPDSPKPKLNKGYHNPPFKSTSEITAKFTATTDDLKVRKRETEK